MLRTSVRQAVAAKHKNDAYKRGKKTLYKTETGNMNEAVETDR